MGCTMEKIKISIITITYNSEKTLRDTLESVRNQHYSNLEYIIVDGESSDSTMDMVNQYSDIVSKCISEKDNGISDAMNKGIHMASGDLIGIIHSDDMLANGALDRLNQEWDGRADVYYGNAIICDRAGKYTHILSSESDLSKMPYRFSIVHPATFVTKKCYDTLGVFDLQYKCAMDYDLLLRFYRAGAIFKYIDASLAVYREGGTNQKYRERTIDEVCTVSIRNGGNPLIANFVKMKKKMKDAIKPVTRRLHINNRRVKQI